MEFHMKTIAYTIKVYYKDGGSRFLQNVSTSDTLHGVTSQMKVFFILEYRFRFYLLQCGVKYGVNL
jgi:hypothetical protein